MPKGWPAESNPSRLAGDDDTAFDQRADAFRAITQFGEDGFAVLSQPWRSRTQRRTLAVDAQRGGDAIQFAAFISAVVQDHLRCLRVRVLREFTQRMHRRARDVARFEQAQPLFAGARAQDPGDGGDRFATMPDPVGASREARVGGQFRNAGGVAKNFPQTIVGDAEEILSQVKSYSDNIEVFDTEGNAVDIAKYGQAESVETANAAGKWALTIDFQGQTVPVNLELKQDGAKVTGLLESMLGTGEIADGKVNGNKFVGAAKTQIQGQDVELVINATIDGDSMEGVVDAGMAGFPPLSFTGMKANKFS